MPPGQRHARGDVGSRASALAANRRQRSGPTPRLCWCWPRCCRTVNPPMVDRPRGTLNAVIEKDKLPVYNAMGYLLQWWCNVRETRAQILPSTSTMALAGSSQARCYLFSDLFIICARPQSSLLASRIKRLRRGSKLLSVPSTPWPLMSRTSVTPCLTSRSTRSAKASSNRN
jgi:hypothetical protein